MTRPALAVALLLLAAVAGCTGAPAGAAAAATVTVRVEALGVGAQVSYTCEDGRVCSEVLTASTFADVVRVAPGTTVHVQVSGQTLSSLGCWILDATGQLEYDEGRVEGDIGASHVSVSCEHQA